MNTFSYPGAERFVEWLYRFENFIFGYTKLNARRPCYLCEIHLKLGGMFIYNFSSNL